MVILVSHNVIFQTCPYNSSSFIHSSTSKPTHLSFKHRFMRLLDSFFDRSTAHYNPPSYTSINTHHPFNTPLQPTLSSYFTHRSNTPIHPSDPPIRSTHLLHSPIHSNSPVYPSDPAIHSNHPSTPLTHPLHSPIHSTHPSTPLTHPLHSPIHSTHPSTSLTHPPTQSTHPPNPPTHPHLEEAQESSYTNISFLVSLTSILDSFPRLCLLFTAPSPPWV